MPDELFSLADTACAVIMVCPIAAGQIGIGNRGAGIGGMEEISVARINTYMGDAACAAGACEENQIAFLQVGFFHICTVLILVSGGTVGGVTKLLQNIVNQTGAVKAGRGGTAACVAGTEIFFCLGKDLCTGDLYSRRRRFSRFLLLGGSVQCGGTGGNTGGFSKAIESGCVGRFLVFVGEFSQVYKITADVGKLVLVDDLVPAVVQAKDITSETSPSTQF